MLHRSNHPRHYAFTFVELMIGIMVTSIVLCALSVFTFGVSQSWTQSESAQSVFLTSTMAVERLTQIVRAAQMTEAYPTPGSLDNSTTPAACMLWTDTINTQGLPIADGKIQYCEMSMLQYDPTTQTIVIYSLPSTATNALTYSSTLLSESAFMRLPNVTPKIVSNNIAACQIFAVNAGSLAQLPSLEIVLSVASANPSLPSQLIYHTVTMRAANSTPQ